MGNQSIKKVQCEKMVRNINDGGAQSLHRQVNSVTPSINSVTVVFGNNLCSKTWCWHSKFTGVVSKLASGVGEFTSGVGESIVIKVTNTQEWQRLKNSDSNFGDGPSMIKPLKNSLS